MTLRVSKVLVALFIVSLLACMGVSAVNAEATDAQANSFCANDGARIAVGFTNTETGHAGDQYWAKTVQYSINGAPYQSMGGENFGNGRVGITPGGSVWAYVPMGQQTIAAGSVSFEVKWTYPEYRGMSVDYLSDSYDAIDCTPDPTPTPACEGKEDIVGFTAETLPGSQYQVGKDFLLVYHVGRLPYKVGYQTVIPAGIKTWDDRCLGGTGCVMDGFFAESPDRVEETLRYHAIPLKAGEFKFDTQFSWLDGGTTCSVTKQITVTVTAAPTAATGEITCERIEAGVDPDWPDEHYDLTASANGIGNIAEFSGWYSTPGVVPAAARSWDQDGVAPWTSAPESVPLDWVELEAKLIVDGEIIAEYDSDSFKELCQVPSAPQVKIFLPNIQR